MRAAGTRSFAPLSAAGGIGFNYKPAEGHADEKSLKMLVMTHHFRFVLFAVGFVGCVLYLLGDGQLVDQVPNRRYFVWLVALLSFTLSAGSWKARDEPRTLDGRSDVVTNSNIIKESHKRSDCVRYGTFAIAGPIFVYILYEMRRSATPSGEGIVGEPLVSAFFYILSMLFMSLSEYIHLYKKTLHNWCCFPEGSTVFKVIMVVCAAAFQVYIIVDSMSDAKNELSGTMLYMVATSYTLYALGYLVYCLGMYIRDPKENTNDEFNALIFLNDFKTVLWTVGDVAVMGFLVFGTLMDAYGRALGGVHFLSSS